MQKAPKELLDRIDQLNLVSIGHRLRTKEDWPLARIAEAERDYRRFLLLLALHPGQTVVPWNDDLDVFWHYHILDSRKYEQDCALLFGRFVHHDPNVNQDPAKYERDKQRTGLL